MPPKLLLVTEVDAGPPDALETAVGLGTALARAGRSVVLVDAALTRPTLHTRMNLPLGPGLAEAVGGKVFRDAVTLPGEEPNLFVLPAGEAALTPEAADRLLDSPATAGLLDGLVRRFDAVLVIAAPVAESGDACSLTRTADAVLLTVRLYVDPAPLVAEAAGQLAAAGPVPFLVVVGSPTDDATPGEVFSGLRAKLHVAGGGSWGRGKRSGEKQKSAPAAAAGVRKEKESLRRPKGSAFWKPTWGTFDWTECVGRARRERCARKEREGAGTRLRLIGNTVASAAGRSCSSRLPSSSRFCPLPRATSQ